MADSSNGEEKSNRAFSAASRSEESGDCQDNSKGAVATDSSLEIEKTLSCDTGFDAEEEIQVKDMEALKGSQFPAGISNDSDDAGVIDINKMHARAFIEEEETLGETHTKAEYEAFTRDDHDNKAAIDDGIAEITISSSKLKQPAKSSVYDDSLDGGGIEESSIMISEEIKAASMSSMYESAAYQPLTSSNIVLPESIYDVELISDVTETIDKEVIFVNPTEPKGKAIDLDLVNDISKDIDTKFSEANFIASSSAASSSGHIWGSTPIQTWQGSSSLTEVRDDQFVQVSLQEPQSETTSRRSSSSSLLERIGLGSFGQEKRVDLSTAESSSFAWENPGLEARSFSGSHEVLAAEESGAAISRHNAEDLNGRSVLHRSPHFSSKSISSFNSSSFSHDRGSSFSSPTGSPHRHRVKAMLPGASPDLMRLIDSAIQGSDPSSLEKLRKVVAEDNSQVQEEGTAHQTSKIVVNVLLAKMGALEGQFDEKDTSTPKMMLSVGAALVAGELIPWLPAKELSENDTDPRTSMVNGLGLILKACTRNRSMCCDAGLLQVLIRAAQTIFTMSKDINSGSEDKWNPDLLLDLLTILGSHCLTVQDLRQWVQATADAIPEGRALDLILPLERALTGEETKGPSHTFEFDGESSGLLGPGESRWPFVNGYAFATWLYIESFADTMHTAATAAAIAAAAVAKSGKSSAMSAAAAASALAGEGTAHMPRLFSFLSADNQGLEAYFHGQFLVVESASSKGKKASLHFTYSFNPRQWYFVGLEHSYRQSILGKTESEVKLYVDGCLRDSRSFEFPRVSKPLAFCCIGTNPPATMAGLQRRRRQCPLFAEMGPVYIFKEPIGEDKMGRLAARGGDAVPAFGFGAGLPSYSANELIMSTSEESVALDTDVESSLHLLYHPKLLVGRSCPDSSPAGAAGAKIFCCFLQCLMSCKGGFISIAILAVYILLMFLNAIIFRFSVFDFFFMTNIS